MSACKTVFKAITAPEAPSNEGLFAPLEVIAPEGTVFTAIRPAPTGWYFEASAFATELMWKALAPVLPEHLSAGSYVSLCAYYIGGVRPNGDYWVQATPQDGGWGAGHDIDGESGLIATTDGDTYNYPAEVIEHAFPLAMERNALNVAAGGGEGRRRGGFGTIREFRMLNPGGGFLLASLGRSVHAALGRRRRVARDHQLLRGHARRRGVDPGRPGHEPAAGGGRCGAGGDGERRRLGRPARARARPGARRPARTGTSARRSPARSTDSTTTSGPRERRLRPRVAVDIGGTFTDVVAFDEASGTRLGGEGVDDTRQFRRWRHRRDPRGGDRAGGRWPRSSTARRWSSTPSPSGVG